MSPAVIADPILKRFRAALNEIYGDRIERVVLFGSRARGDAGEDSDYDVAVFLNDLKEGDLADRWRELDRLADLRSGSSPTPRPSSTPSRTRPAPIGTRRR